jgi:hypothetical protein
MNKAIFLSLNAFKKIVGTSNLTVEFNPATEKLFVLDQTNDMTFRCEQALDTESEMAWRVPLDEYADRQTAIMNACLVNVKRGERGERKIVTKATL